MGFHSVAHGSKVRMINLYALPFELFRRHGYLTLLKSFRVPWYQSRSVPGLHTQYETLDVLRIEDGICLR